MVDIIFVENGINALAHFHFMDSGAHAGPAGRFPSASDFHGSASFGIAVVLLLGTCAAHNITYLLSIRHIS